MRLTITNATKSFGKKRILDNVSFTTNIGEILGVFGRNGTGKSTLLKCIFGSLKANTIEIVIEDKKINPKQIIPHKKIAYLPQDSFLPKEKKVRDIIPFLYEGELQDKIFYAPRISEIANKTIGALSLGERRYLEVMLIGYLDHPFLMMDEPFSMIEPLYKDLIRAFFLELTSSKGFILTDHYYKDVLAITDHNILIKDQKSIQIKDKADLIKFGYLGSEV